MVGDDGHGTRNIVRTIADKRINSRGHLIRNLCNAHGLIIANGTKDKGDYTRKQGKSHTVLDLTIMQLKEWKQYRKMSSQLTIWSDHAIVRTEFRRPNEMVRLEKEHRHKKKDKEQNIKPHTNTYLTGIPFGKIKI